MKYNLEVDANYFQISVQDYYDSDFVGYELSETSIKEQIAVGKNLFIILTVSERIVPLTLEILDNKPVLNYEDWDHIVECGLNVVSGLISVDYAIKLVDCTFYLKLAKGNYGVLIGSKNLDSVENGGLDGDDSYHIFLWPESKQVEKKVLKQWIDLK